MTCCICTKTIKAIEYEGEPNPNYVPKKGFDELINMTMWNDGVVDSINPGYGSKHDMMSMRVAFCDDCISDRLSSGIIQKF